MTDWVISDQEIESIERLLLSNGAHFPEDARAVIRCWHSTDVCACPGSGKTTILLAKLKLLADRMPLEKSAGICVLSHTNVAVNEIKVRLSGCADKLLSYPNYIGTIQSFVDKFVTMQYLRGKCKTSLQFVGNEDYGRYLYNWVTRDRSHFSQYRSLRNYIQRKCSSGHVHNTNEEKYYQNITIGKDGIYNGKTKIASLTSESGKQYVQAKKDLLMNAGILLYRDTYLYANEAVDHLSEEYTELFSKRFQYVFIDEYQDCDEEQRLLLHKIFNENKCCVIHIGDSDQAIYNGMNDDITDWKPNTGYLIIASSSRYTQEIANILVPLRKNRESIVSASGECGYKPVLIVFDRNDPARVVAEYRKQIIRRALNTPHGIHYAIGFRRENTSGLSVGSYWEQFDSTRTSNGELKYWTTIDAISLELIKGKLYRAEFLIRKLIYAVSRELGVRNTDTGKLYTNTTIHELLTTKYREYYADNVCSLSMIDPLKREMVEERVRHLIATIIDNQHFYDDLSGSFLTDSSQSKNQGEKNVNCVDGINIRFDTIHAVKGKTHSSTLYLETDYKNGSDLGRILHLYGAGDSNSSTLYDYCRKLAYVGMSRPRQLLCVAMCSKTYDKSKGAFDTGLWEVVDLREIEE